MINQDGFRLLANLPNETTRFFCRLMADADLTVYRAMNPVAMGARYGLKSDVVMAMIDNLHGCELLERGPSVRVGAGKDLINTYKVRKVYRLTGKELEAWENFHAVADLATKTSAGT